MTGGHCSKLLNWALEGYWTNQQQVTWLFPLVFFLNHALIAYFYYELQFHEETHSNVPFLSVLVPQIHMCVAQVYMLFAQFWSWTFLAHSFWCHESMLHFWVVFWKLGLHDVETSFHVVGMSHSSPIWIHLQQCVHKLYQCPVFQPTLGLFDHIVGLILL